MAEPPSDLVGNYSYVDSQYKMQTADCRSIRVQNAHYRLRPKWFLGLILRDIFTAFIGGNQKSKFGFDLDMPIQRI